MTEISRDVLDDLDNVIHAMDDMAALISHISTQEVSAVYHFLEGELVTLRSIENRLRGDSGVNATAEPEGGAE